MLLTTMTTQMLYAAGSNYDKIIVNYIRLIFYFRRRYIYIALNMNTSICWEKIHLNQEVFAFVRVKK